ncbi:MAG: UbiA-like polyprenyltransferase [Hyphomicrobiales bacterium]
MHQPNASHSRVGAASKSTLILFFKFTKIEHTAFSLPLVIAGSWIATQGRSPGLPLLLLIVTAAAGARIFGMSFNRIFDRSIDARNPRTASRELPSGRMSMRMALAVALIGLGVYFTACTILGGWCLVLSPVPLIPLLGYSLLKRFTALCHFGIGLCLALAPLGAYVATAGGIRFSSGIILFAVFVFFWLSGADIIYSVLDLDNDLAHGIRSLPAQVGPRNALAISGACELIAFGALAAVYIVSGCGVASTAALLLTAAAMALMLLPAIPAALRFFPISTAAGIFAAFVPILGHWF